MPWPKCGSNCRRKCRRTLRARSVRALRWSGGTCALPPAFVQRRMRRLRCVAGRRINHPSPSRRGAEVYLERRRGHGRSAREPCTSRDIAPGARSSPAQRPRVCGQEQHRQDPREHRGHHHWLPVQCAAWMTRICRPSSQPPSRRASTTRAWRRRTTCRASRKRVSAPRRRPTRRSRGSRAVENTRCAVATSRRDRAEAERVQEAGAPPRVAPLRTRGCPRSSTCSTSLLMDAPLARS